MTDKEALAENIRKFLKSDEGLLMTGKDWETIVKALEQEDVLDKIRAEIIEKENTLGCAKVSDVALKTAYIEALQIIDKYRQEG